MITNKCMLIFMNMFTCQSRSAGCCSLWRKRVSKLNKSASSLQSRFVNIMQPLTDSLRVFSFPFLTWGGPQASSISSLILSTCFAEELPWRWVLCVWVSSTWLPGHKVSKQKLVFHFKCQNKNVPSKDSGLCRMRCQNLHHSRVYCSAG